MTDFKFGDRVVVSGFRNLSFYYGNGFKENVKLNKDVGVIVKIETHKIKVQFSRDFGGLWGEGFQDCPECDLALEGQEITGRVMVIGEL